MTLKLKAALYEALDNFIADQAIEPNLDYYITPKLVEQMTNAAELVFDVSQDGQNYAFGLCREDKYNEEE